MAKKKAITAKQIITFYMEYVLERQAAPPSVHTFAKLNNFDEALFYEHFGNFEAVEKAVFKTFYENTVAVLQKSEDYPSFDARHKLLSFYYTFFELLTANRSYVVYALRKHRNRLKNLAILSELKKSFTAYIRELNIETLDLKAQNLEKLQQRSLQESAWVQLLLTLKFWMDDTSPAFEKTDVFIEKSVNTSFDLLDTKPLKSIIDFGKFLWKERANIKV